MKPLDELTATEIVGRVRAGSLRVVDLVTALLERIERVEPEVRAWAMVDATGALAAAEALDLAAAAGDVRPLHGVPLGVKDIIDVAGLPTQAGFAPYRERIPAGDAAVVARLRELGAVVLGKTHTTQFANADPAPTRNPFNRERTPGGSSSGSGAAVAARMAPAALGTQTAGSVLRPAAYCGVVGYKPTFNWVSREGVLPLAWSLDHVGLIARTVEDAALLYGAIVGEAVETAGFNHPRIGVLTEFVERAEPVVADHLHGVVTHLEAAGAELVAPRLPVDLDLALTVHHVIMQAEVGAVHAEQLAEHPDDYGRLLRLEVEAGQLVPSAYEIKARRLRRGITREIDRVLGQFDAVLLPTASNPAPPPETTGDRTFQALWTMLGTPALSLPTGLSPDGLPLACQLVGRRGSDRQVLATAAWCARQLGMIPLPDLA